MPRKLAAGYPQRHCTFRRRLRLGRRETSSGTSAVPPGGPRRRRLLPAPTDLVRLTVYQREAERSRAARAWTGSYRVLCFLAGGCVTGSGPAARFSSVVDPGTRRGVRDFLSALVTGATSGIGEAAAKEIARHGAEVIVHGRDAARGAAVVDAITVEGGKARFLAADLADADELAAFAEEVGAVDILVNNAGIGWSGPTDTLDLATYDVVSTPTSGRHTSLSPR